MDDTVLLTLHYRKPSVNLVGQWYFSPHRAPASSASAICGMSNPSSGPKLIGAVAQDSYQIGYNAVEQAVFAIEGKTVTADVGIEGTWWDSTNVDDMIASNIVYEG